MPTIVYILTFISMINTSEKLKARNFFICQYFSLYEQLKFPAQLSWAWKKFYNLGAWSGSKLFDIWWYSWIWNNFLKTLILNKLTTVKRSWNHGKGVLLPFFIISHDQTQARSIYRSSLRLPFQMISIFKLCVKAKLPPINLPATTLSSAPLVCLCS